MNKQKLLDELAKLASCLEDFKGITGYCDGKYAAYEIAIELAKQLDEPQDEKVEVTEKEAIEIEEHKQAGESVYEYLDSITVSTNLDDDRLAKAYLFGYTVKPKWVVKSKDHIGLESFVNSTINPMWTTEEPLWMAFTDHAKAEAVATLVEGSVEEI